MPAKRKRHSKAAHGMGTITKLSGNRTEPYALRAPAVLLPNGKYSRQLIGTYKTRREAELARGEYIRNPVTQLAVTFKQVYDAWSARKFPKISDSTAWGYKASYLKCELLYSRKFRDLRRADFQEIIDNNLDMSYSALTKLRGFFSQLYKYALAEDIVHKDYSRYLEIDKDDSTDKIPFADIDFKRIESAVDVIEWADVIYLMCYTGHRIGEILSLTKGNYDPRNDCLIGGNKTTAGERKIVPVHPKIKPILTRWLNKGGERIICKPDGSAISQGYFRVRCFYPTLEKLGIKYRNEEGKRIITPHSTRKTCATRMAAAGMREENMIAILGHEDYTITKEKYIMPEAKTLRDEMLKLS